MTLHATMYHGGKSGIRPVGKWIRSLLPPDRSVTYVEPYAGMLGVLLNRPRSSCEIANDLNGRIVNWWRMIRDHPDEFARRIALTPYSEEMYREASASLDDGSPMARAINLSLVLTSSMGHGDGGLSSGFAVTYLPNSGSPSKKFHSIADRVPRLAERMKDVQLLNRPAIKILERIVDEDGTVIYCDPPYAGTVTKHYAVDESDRDHTFDLLRSQRGRVAISGYGDEWDDLGWHRSTLDRTMALPGQTGESRPRTEVLWTNYRPDQQIELGEES